MRLRGAKIPMRDSELGLRDAELPMHDPKNGLRDAEIRLRGSEMRLRDAEMPLHSAEIALHDAEIPACFPQSPFMRHLDHLNRFPIRIMLASARDFELATHPPNPSHSHQKRQRQAALENIESSSFRSRASGH